MKLLTGANFITISRVFIVPPLIISILNEKIYISGFLVILAVLTDYLDGIIARRYNITTDSGKLLDPAVDKIFTISILTAFVEKQYISSFWVYFIVLREMLITWIRSLGAKKGYIISASNEGKLKTICQFGAIFLISIKVITLGKIFLLISIFLAYYSGIMYFINTIKEMET